MFTITICCCTHHLPVISIKTHISFFISHISNSKCAKIYVYTLHTPSEKKQRIALWCIAVSICRLMHIVIDYIFLSYHSPSNREIIQTKRNLKMIWLKCHIYPAASYHSWSNGNSIKCIYVYHRYHIFLCNKNKFSVFPTPVFRHDHV